MICGDAIKAAETGPLYMGNIQFILPQIRCYVNIYDVNYLEDDGKGEHWRNIRTLAKLLKLNDMVILKKQCRNKH